jgi:hypothetical protein
MIYIALSKNVQWDYCYFSWGSPLLSAFAIYELGAFFVASGSPIPNKANKAPG